MILVHVGGTPYEIGYQHGVQLRALIDGLVKYETRDYDRAVVERSAELYQSLAYIERHAPEFLEELNGIADGAQVDYGRLLYVNLKYFHYCTTVSFSHSADGPLLGKNLDYPGFCFLAVFRVLPDRGLPFYQIACAGTVSPLGGLNAHGLALGHSVVFLKDVPDHYEGLPVSFLRRQVLQSCSSTAEAVERIVATPTIRVGDNIVLNDRGGNTCVIEKAPQASRVLGPVDGAAYCSNTFTHPDLREFTLPKDEPVQRFGQVAALLAERTDGALSAQSLERVLGYADGACPIRRKSTQISYIAYPRQLMLKIADGYPDVHGYEDFVLTF